VTLPPPTVPVAPDSEQVWSGLVGMLAIVAGVVAQDHPGAEQAADATADLEGVGGARDGDVGDVGGDDCPAAVGDGARLPRRRRLRRPATVPLTTC